MGVLGRRKRARKAHPAAYHSGAHDYEDDDDDRMMMDEGDHYNDRHRYYYGDEDDMEDSDIKGPAAGRYLNEAMSLSSSSSHQYGSSYYRGTTEEEDDDDDDEDEEEESIGTISSSEEDDHNSYHSHKSSEVRRNVPIARPIPIKLKPSASSCFSSPQSTEAMVFPVTTTKAFKSKPHHQHQQHAAATSTRMREVISLLFSSMRACLDADRRQLYQEALDAAIAENPAMVNYVEGVLGCGMAVLDLELEKDRDYLRNSLIDATRRGLFAMQTRVK